MTTEEKLKHFEESSMERARAQSMEIISKHQEALKQIEKEHKETKRRQADLQIRTETESLKHQINMALSKEQIEIRRRITRHQNELKDTLFQEVQERLEAFRSTQQYQNLLLSQIQEILKMADHQEVTIYLDPADASIQKSLEEACKVPLTLSAYSFLGGTRAVLSARHILIDNSFETRLAEEKEAFTFEGGASQ